MAILHALGNVHVGVAPEGAADPVMAAEDRLQRAQGAGWVRHQGVFDAVPFTMERQGSRLRAGALLHAPMRNDFVAAGSFGLIQGSVGQL